MSSHRKPFLGRRPWPQVFSSKPAGGPSGRFAGRCWGNQK
jgi:hypothetical protein